MTGMKYLGRFFAVFALMLATAVFLYSRSQPEKLPPRLALDSFPRQIQSWTGQDVRIPEDNLKVLGAGEFMLRIYRRPEDRPYVDLFIAFFPSQRAGDTIHSPQNCLPGAGWEPLESRKFQIIGARGDQITVNRYLIAKGENRQVVFYWYQAHGRAVASEYWAKYFLVRDSIQMNRTDGALVRVVTPLEQNESVDGGQKRALEFMSNIMPMLSKFIPD